MWPAGDPGRIRGGQTAGSPAEAAGFAGAGTPTRLPWSSGSPGRVGTPADGVCSCCPQGTSTKYSPQRVGLTHTVEHEDVIQIVKK